MTTTPIPRAVGFHVVGLPAPQGSKRSLGNGVMVESSHHPLYRLPSKEVTDG